MGFTDSCLFEKVLYWVLFWGGGGGLALFLEHFSYLSSLQNYLAN